MKKRVLYKDPYSNTKFFEVTKLSGGYYLKEILNGKQFGRGVRTTKRSLKLIGITDMPMVSIYYS